MEKMMMLDHLIPLDSLQDLAKAHRLMKQLKSIASLKRKRCLGILPFA